MKYCLIDKTNKIGYSISKYPDMFNMTLMCFTHSFDDEETAVRHKDRIKNPDYNYEVMTVKEAMLYSIDYDFRCLYKKLDEETPNINYIKNVIRHIKNARDRLEKLENV